MISRVSFPWIVMFSALGGCNRPPTPTDVPTDVSDVSVSMPDDVEDEIITRDVPRPDVPEVDVPRDIPTLDAPILQIPDDVVYPDVAMPPTCGNNTLNTSMGEECDDGNVADWDGCNRLCRIEQTVRVNDAQILPTPLGCDLDRDGMQDNRFSSALGTPALALLNSSLRDGVANGSVSILGAFIDLDDRLGMNDPFMRVGFFTGVPALPPFRNTAGEAFTVTRSQFNSMGQPLGLLQYGSVVNQFMISGPGDVPLAIAIGSDIPTLLTLQRGQVSGTTAPNNTLMQIESISGGILCGALSARDLDRIAPPMAVPTNCRGVGSSMLDVLVLGCGFLLVGGQPDIDLGGDGVFTGPGRSLRDTDGDRVIDTCRDGTTGVTITGNDCAQDPAFDDAYSVAIRFSAQRVVISSVVNN